MVVPNTATITVAASPLSGNRGHSVRSATSPQGTWTMNSTAT